MGDEAASPANYLDLKERVAGFADVEAYASPWQAPVTGLEHPLALRTAPVTGGLFSMLGVPPMLGRGFTGEESWASATWRAGETPLLLSADTWRSVFGGDEAVIGRSITLNGGPARVVGVMPDGFAFPEEGVQLWMPFGWADEARDATWFRHSRSIRPVARLADGATPEEAAAELAAVAARLGREHPEFNHRVAIGMSPLQDFLLGDTRTPLLVLLGAVALLLLIACANAGNLLLVRASAHRRGLAIRAALGAGSGRLVRQTLTESVVLAALGGTAGIALGVAGTRLLERLQPAGLLRVTSFPVDGGVIAFAVAVTAGAAMLFGTFPALLARRTGPGEALREAGRSGSPGRLAGRVVGGLVVAEVASSSSSRAPRTPSARSTSTSAWRGATRPGSCRPSAPSSTTSTRSSPSSAPPPCRTSSPIPWPVTGSSCSCSSPSPPWPWFSPWSACTASPPRPPGSACSSWVYGGPRRPGPRHRLAHHPARPRARRHGGGAGRGRRARGDASHDRHALRRHPERSRDVRRGGRFSDHRRPRRIVAARPAGGGRGPGGHGAGRVVRAAPHA